MYTLSIETSCDETALSIIQTNDDQKSPNFSVKSNLVISQIATHAPYGGVFPALAKREHAKNLVPLLLQCLDESSLLMERETSLPAKKGKVLFNTASKSENNNHNEILSKILEREPDLAMMLSNFFNLYQQPPIDFIMVTHGPGLTPALWVGVNFARVLGMIWNIPILPVNHMEGHVSSILLKDDYETNSKALQELDSFQFPMLALLISGGHTQLVLVRHWGDYEIIGETLDDAVGEAFDKVARMLGMPYPGGPQIYQAAKTGITNPNIRLPRPMLQSDSYQFSFSGLKTAVRYLIEKLGGLPSLQQQDIADIATEFQQATTDVLLTKTRRALLEYNAHGLIIAGGVAANQFIRSSFEQMIAQDFEHVRLFFPERNLCGDNSLMIASAGFLRYIRDKESSFVHPDNISAVGNLRL